MVREFDSDEWGLIMKELKQNPENYGLPQRKFGSVVLASFNIRKLGSVRKRRKETWEFLAYVCSHFDLISVQEIMEDLRGVYELKNLMGPEYGMVISDTTGVFPGEAGLGERLAFIYRRLLVQRADVVTDISLDRTKILDTLAIKFDDFEKDIKPWVTYFKKMEKWEKNGQLGSKPKKPKIHLSFFLDFIRAPYCVGFRIAGHPDAKPYEFMAVNAHLYYGNYMSDRELEFRAVMQWIIERVKRSDRTYFPNFILLGDLNLNFDKPKKDREEIEEYMKTFNAATGQKIHVNFPFIDIHPKEIQEHGNNAEVYRTNARLNQTYDQIGLFFSDPRFPTFDENDTMGNVPEGPDYGVFNFVELFSIALHNTPFEGLSEKDQKEFVKRFEHEVSDHMPLWLKLPVPQRD
ncbi:MAG: endonuclease/exonuclease/phosphatase [Candidatus Kariarchaeaceae archaeon]